MRSTEVIIILLQQYRLMTWRSSRALAGSSPAVDLRLELLELVADELAAGETADWYQQLRYHR